LVIIHGRDKSRTQAVCEEIKSETGNNNVDMLLADLFLLSDVKRMAVEFKKKYDRLDVLINNAGAVFGKDRETTKEGLEKTMTLNLFAPFLLTELLLDVLAKSLVARIINVSSAAHAIRSKPDLSDIQLEKSYSFIKAYGLSKLYIIWVTRHLVRELKEKGLEHITANSLHPGVIASEFGKSSDIKFVNLLTKLMRPFLLTNEQGAETTIYLAVSKDVEHVTGKYFAKKKVAKESVKHYSPENEKIVWDYCKKIVEPYLETENK
jgi:NAD(P)-dependent dehydrogenase (short-subunit alcohol dehydrogenase family)